MSRGVNLKRHDPQYTTLIETADRAAINWWMSLTPCQRGEVISAVMPREKPEPAPAGERAETSEMELKT